MCRYPLRRSGLVLCGLLLAAGLALPVAGPAPAGEPKPKPLTDKKEELLKERNRLANEANQLAKAGKFTEMAAIVEKVVALDRRIYGDAAEEIAASLDVLARIHAVREDFKAARKAREEELAIRTKLYGEMDWRVIDTRWTLEELDRKAKIDAGSRKQRRKAHDLGEQVARLLGEGRFREALPLAEQARDLYKKLLTENHPDYATCLLNLAGLYQGMGQSSKALPLAEQARDLFKK